MNDRKTCGAVILLAIVGCAFAFGSTSDSFWTATPPPRTAAPPIPTIETDSLLHDGARVQHAGILKRVFQKRLRIRVVDPNGVPIPDVNIWVRVSWDRTLAWESHHEEFRASTDKNGEYEVSTPDSVGMHIFKDGYYGNREFWQRQDIPHKRVDIVLDPEHEPVEMHVGSIRFTKHTDADRYEFGIVFLKMERARENEAVTMAKEDADLWVELYREGHSTAETGDANEVDANDIWQMRITGQNGWRLCPEMDSSREMREAPEGPYVEVVEGSFKSIPKGNYLQKNGGERYGRLTMNVHDMSRFGKINRYCSMSYNVQAEPSGTRSLNWKQ